VSGLPPIAPGLPAGAGTAGAAAPPLPQQPTIDPATLAALTKVEPPAPTSQAAPPTAPQAALQAAVQSAATTQGGLGLLLADLEAAVQWPATPAPVQAAAAQVLAQQLPLDPPPSAADLKQAVAQSGLFLEAQLAQPDTQDAPSDLKSALLNLNQALQTWSDEVATQTASGAPATTPPPTTAAATLVAQTLAPPPPYKGGPVRGQAPAAASLPLDTPADAIVARLRQDTTAALSRQTLMQAASTPDAPSGQSQTTAAAHWLFEIPLATPQGPAIAQFEIDRDGGSASSQAGADSRVWRARFSLDVTPMGPVHARIALHGDAARVTLWAEDAETAAKLTAHQGELADALLADQLEPQVQIVSGAPAAPTPPPSGRLMDKAV
jgi:hypothetical protein